MMGRYGFDAFSQGLLVASIIVVVINFLLHSSILSVMALFLMLLAIVRMFSRDHASRAKENHVYESLMVKPRAWWARMNAQADDRRRRAQQRDATKKAPAGAGVAREYEFFICEQCGQRLTVPKGKGRLKVTCPTCGNVTIRES